jgi:di/tricarboxylate transporter
MTLSDEDTTSQSQGGLSRKQLIAAAVFAAIAALMAWAVPTIEIAWVSTILLLTIYLFAFEVVEVDVAAATVMVLLGLTSLFAPVMGLSQGLVDTAHLFDGFSSNAVISIIAVMIIGAGLDKTGIMSKVAAFILKVGGTTEARIIPIISATVGVISSFMQNVGAAALFLPVVSRISARSGLPMSRLLMPMGFCAILGGTVTMVGSSPLILLNDLILTSNQALPADQQMDTWGLFSVTPVGLALVATGIIYFVLAGRFVLPVTQAESTTTASDAMGYFRDVYGVDYALFEVVVPEGSPLAGKTLDEVETSERIRVIANKRSGEETRIGPGALARDTGIETGMVLGIIADPQDLDRFVEKYGLKKRDDLRTFTESLASTKAGIAEVLIPPGSNLIGKSARDVWMRKTYGLAMVGLHRNGKTLREGEDIRNIPFQAGDTLVVHTTWDALARIEKDRNFVVITTEYPREELRPHKVGAAGVFFAIALTLVLFTDIRLSVVGGAPGWVIQTAVAALATFFTLVMSNVGATVLLVPLAVNIAIGVGADPAVYALTVAIATSNSFIIPTHQVNALIMGPAGYRVPDFMRAGGIMTVLFLVVMMLMMNLVF